MAYSLFNDWLTSYKEALHYRMVQQASEIALQGQRLCCAHGHSIFDHAEIKTACVAVPCVSARFECTLSCMCVCMRVSCLNYLWYMHKHTT